MDDMSTEFGRRLRWRRNFITAQQRRSLTSVSYTHLDVYKRQLYLTAVFAAVVREVALAPAPPRGDLLLLAVADEEAGGEYGLKWLLREHPGAFRVTEALSESGGMRLWCLSLIHI